MSWLIYETTIGRLYLKAHEGSLTHIYFSNDRDDIKDSAESGKVEDSEKTVLAETVKQLDAYFAGQLRLFDLPLKVEGTPFMQAVWREMAKIPFGQTMTYGELAAKIGRPKAARAVGMACNRNPLPIVVPCHRVVGSKGALTGFRGGLDIKKQLLKHEGMDFE